MGVRLVAFVLLCVAARACLLLLNRPADYFRNVRQIPMYPHPFVVNRTGSDSSGVLQAHWRAPASAG